MNLQLTQAAAADAPALVDLILTHGPNEWNWLPPDGIRAHLAGLADGSTQALAAWHDGQPVAVVTWSITRRFASDQRADRGSDPHGYVGEAVVHRQWAGKGLGGRLLGAAVEAMAAAGLQDIYIDRHEENAASAGMMRKAGFALLRIDADPERRPKGSGRTALCVWRADPA